MKKIPSIIIIILVFMLGACGPAGEPSVPVEELTGNPTKTAGPTLTPTTATTLTPVPEIPEGWREHTLSSPDIVVHAPAGWDLIPRDGDTADLRDSASGAWVELALVTGENAYRYGFDASAGLSVEMMMAILKAALDEDGAFNEPEAAWPWFARSLKMVEGINEIHEENLLIAVVEREADFILMTAHASDSGGDWIELREIYSMIAASIH